MEPQLHQFFDHIWNKENNKGQEMKGAVLVVVRLVHFGVEICTDDIYSHSAYCSMDLVSLDTPVGANLGSNLHEPVAVHEDIRSSQAVVVGQEPHS